MQLHSKSIGIDETCYPRCEEWHSGAQRLLDDGRCVLYRLSAAPPGKHELADCPKYEAAWRDVVPAVLDLV